MQFFAVFYEELVVAEFEDVGELERNHGPTSVVASPLPLKEKKNINKMEKIDISLFWVWGSAYNACNAFRVRQKIIHALSMISDP